MAPRRYAETTTVSVQKSQQELAHILQRAGADTRRLPALPEAVESRGY